VSFGILGLNWIPDCPDYVDRLTSQAGQSPMLVILLNGLKLSGDKAALSISIRKLQLFPRTVFERCIQGSNDLSDIFGIINKQNNIKYYI